jgi:hypothetical protein
VGAVGATGWVAAGNVYDPPACRMAAASSPVAARLPVGVVTKYRPLDSS